VKEPHLLRASGNPRRLIENIRHLISSDSEEQIESALDENIVALYELGRTHYRFARRLAEGSWRHTVSRLYYAGYNTTRSVRLCVDGHYSQDVKDHHRFEQLPGDFPSRDRYANDLPLLRDDRNLCDYDHTAEPDDLVRPPRQWAKFVSELMRDAKRYLEGRGVTL